MADIGSSSKLNESVVSSQIVDGTIATADIAADAITNAKIADGQVDTEHLAASAVETAKINDNAVTLAKMAGGTDGQIITYDASGDPVAVGPGSDGQVLTSTGAGSPPAFEAVPSFDTDAAQVFNESGADADFRVEGDSEQNLLFVDASTDRVGIGTASPSAPLHLSQSVNGDVQFIMENTEGGSSSTNESISLIFRNSNGSGGNVGDSRIFVGKESDHSSTANSDDYMDFYTVDGGTAGIRMRITHDGKIGIGTNTPSALIHADGSVRGGIITTTTTGDEVLALTASADNAGGGTQYSGRMVTIFTNTDAGTGYNFLYLRADENNNGTPGQNAVWRVRGDGGTYADNAYSSGGADYAEYFESKNGNEIVVGTTVKLDGDKIVPCDSETSPIGVIRAKNGNSVVVGNAYNNRWCQMYKQDDYGAYEYDDGKHLVGNPAYIKPTEENPYIPREERDEWCLVGLLGQVPITKGQPVADNWIKMKDVSDTVEMWFIK